MAPRKADPTAWRFTAGRLSLDFVGTVGYRPTAHVERLTEPAALRDWLLEAGLPAARLTPVDADLQRARAVREALYALLDALLGGPPAPRPAEEIALLNEVAAAPPPAPVVAVRPGGATVEYQARDELDPLLSAIVRDGLELIGGELLGQVRRCAAEDCRKLFLDTAPRPRRWCSAQLCGTRNRVAAHRARHRS